ncbi:MAG: hypothetical protein FWE20_11770, partial [Defluviitaleaceae bacterium]|nr:hypothetical protein [Defluviitaleaceae bacterium]
VTAGAGGFVFGGGAFPISEIVAVVAQPEPGFHFLGWYENDIRIANAGATYIFGNAHVHGCRKRGH